MSALSRAKRPAYLDCDELTRQASTCEYVVDDGMGAAISNNNRESAENAGYTYATDNGPCGHSVTNYQRRDVSQPVVQLP
jgi:hypothetical protein